MRANRAYRLLHTRGGRAPSRFAARDRYDQVEVVEVASGETVLFWDIPAREVRGLLRDLRAGLSGLDADAFIQRWGTERSTPIDR